MSQDYLAVFAELIRTPFQHLELVWGIVPLYFALLLSELTAAKNTFDQRKWRRRKRGLLVPSVGSCSSPAHSLKVSPGHYLSIGAGASTGTMLGRNETIYPEGVSPLAGDSSAWQRRDQHTERGAEESALRLRQRP